MCEAIDIKALPSEVEYEASKAAKKAAEEKAERAARESAGGKITNTCKEWW